MNTLRTLTIAALATLALGAFAQTPAPKPAAPAAAAPKAAAGPTASDMEILRQKVKADKKLVVAANMQLTEAEAKAFWPIYDDYQKQLSEINGRLEKSVMTYADAYKKGPIANEVAKKLVDEYLAIEDSEVKLKRDFAPKVEKAVGPAKSMRYLQIETKIRALIKYELAANVPLVN